METVLVVDDEPTLREVVVRYLERAGYRALEAGDGDEAEALLRNQPPDLVILDLMLPGTDGLELCRRIRADSALPVIMLTARGEEADRIVGLELGADDYVTKPFSPRELVARVRTVLRRTNGPVEARDRIQHGDLTLDSETRDVRKSGSPRLADRARVRPPLVPRLPSAAGLFAGAPNEPCLGLQPAYDTGTVTVHIRRLRAKIEDDAARPRHIETVWGVGYRFSP